MADNNKAHPAQQCPNANHRPHPKRHNQPAHPMKNPDPSTRLSKHLSFVLRHHPESIGIALDAHGWADIAILIRQMNAHGTATAHKVGQRHGKPAVLRIAAGQMQRDGHTFYQSDNGVWLTDHVPLAYITFDD